MGLSSLTRLILAQPPLPLRASFPPRWARLPLAGGVCGLPSRPRLRAVWPGAAGCLTVGTPRYVESLVPALNACETTSVVCRLPALLALIGLSTTVVIAQEPRPSGVIVLGSASKDSSDWIAIFACSPDGRLIATARYNRIIELWDLKTGKVVETLLDAKGGRLKDFNTSERGIDDLRFSTDGKYLAAAGYNFGLKIWSPDTAKLYWQYPEREGSLAEVHTALDFSGDGRLLVTVNGFHGEIDVWNVTEKKRVSTIKGHKHYVNSLALTPNGESLYSCSSDLTVRKWDVATGKELWRVGTEREDTGIGPTFPHQLRLSPDGKYIAVTYHGCWQLGGTLLDAQTSKQLSQFDVDHSDGLAFMRTENVFVYQGKEGRPTLIDASTRKAKARFPEPLPNRVMRFEFTPDGKRLVIPRHDGTLGIWDLSGFEPLKD